MRSVSLLLVSITTVALPRIGQAVDFARDVQPILAEHCLECHGADSAEGGLRLDRQSHAFEKAESGSIAIVPHDVSSSGLLQRVTSTDEDWRMPPEGDPLSPRDIDTLKKWIEAGAAWSDHWAYRPLNATMLPEVSNADWCNSPIDRFVLAKLESSNIAPSPKAPREKLIRRLSYDLLGLPPSIAEVQHFVNDKSINAYERQVERMLASPRFGERWGRHWLDKARYADSDGYEKDRNRPNAWRYRDWVIDAINDDMPYDQFTIEQLAGDLLTNATDEQRLATAFNRQTLTNTEGGTDQEQWRVAAVMDRTETIGTVWLGLTVGCARCHNHKYDQISHAEYYQLYAYFNNADETNHGLEPTKEQLAQFLVDSSKHKAKLAEKKQQLAQLNVAAEPPCEVEQCAEDQQRAADGPSTNPVIAKKKQRDALLEEIEKLSKSTPKRPVFQARVIAERKDKRRNTHILRRGEFKEPLDRVNPNTLDSLPAIAANGEPERLRFARWLVDGNNPLVQRVAVNHVWQKLFGVGLVATPNDFGVRGELPSHPKLLDHLAADLVNLGWSRKALIRSIVLSATYRQSSDHRPELADIDANNRLLYRQNRFRMEAESMRDIALSTAGLLSNRIGGPSVFPPMPPEAAAVSYANNFKWNTSGGEDRYRRGLYTFFKRTAPHPTLITFDCPDANVTNVERNRSNTPIGALVLLNNEVYSESAIAMAATLLAGANKSASDSDRIRLGFQRCVARPPTVSETEKLAALLSSNRDYFRANPDSAVQFVGDAKSHAIDINEHASWAATLRVLLNLDEFITRD